MDKNILKKLSKKKVHIKNVTGTPLWYTKCIGKLDSGKTQASIEEHTKKLMCNYLSAARKLYVYFAAEMAQAYGVVRTGSLADDAADYAMPSENCTTEAEKRRYEKLMQNRMAVLQQQDNIKAAAADAQALIDAANSILLARMDVMRKNTFAHIHAYLSGVCSKNSETDIDLSQCLKECMVNTEEDKLYEEKDIS